MNFGNAPKRREAMWIRWVVLVVAALFILQLAGLRTAALPSRLVTFAFLVLLLSAQSLFRRDTTRTPVVRIQELLRRHSYALAMLAIVVVYLTIQLRGLGVGLDHAPLDIDEQRLASTVSAFFHDGTIPHQTVEDYPGVFYWGVVAAYLLAFLELLMRETVRAFTDIQLPTLVFIGRLLSTMLFTGTIVLTGTMSRRLLRPGNASSSGLGLLAAGLTALAPLALSISSQFRNDTALLLLAVGTAVLALQVYDTASPRLAVLTGALAGLAAGVKYSGAFALPCGIVAAWVAPGTARHRARLSLWVVGGFVVSLAASNPFLWLDFPNFIHQLGTEIHMSGAGHWSAVSNPPAFYTRSLAQALGLPLLLIAGGVLVMTLTRRSPRVAILVAFVIPYQLFMSGRPAQFPRWVFPLVPFVASLGAWGTVTLAGRIRRAARVSRRRGRRWLLTATGALLWVAVLVPFSTLAGVAASRRFVPSTYERLETWLRAQAPSAKRAVTEAGWLDGELDGVEIARVQALETIRRHKLWAGTFDWIVVPEPRWEAVASFLGEPLIVFRADYGWAGSRGYDFAVYAGSSTWEPRSSLHLALEDARADRFAGPGWDKPQPGLGRALREEADLYLPLRAGGEYVLTLSVELDVAAATGDGSAPISAEIDGVELVSVDGTCRTAKPLSMCRFLLPQRTIGPRVAVLHLRNLTDSPLWIDRVVVSRRQ